MVGFGTRWKGAKTNVGKVEPAENGQLASTSGISNPMVFQWQAAGVFQTDQPSFRSQSGKNNSSSGGRNRAGSATGGACRIRGVWEFFSGRSRDCLLVSPRWRPGPGQ